jgi:hypothetical protein
LGADFIELIEMLMPMLDTLVHEQSCMINLSAEVVIGNEEAGMRISYQNGLPVLEDITF